jgi:hypothetical protein
MNFSEEVVISKPLEVIQTIVEQKTWTEQDLRGNWNVKNLFETALAGNYQKVFI